MNSQIPAILLDQLRKGQAILFLGSGASIGAEHPSNKRTPVGNQLADLMAERFLGEEFKGQSLDRIAELAISESDLTTVQEFIRDVFMDFSPAAFHKIIPTLPWRALATTNYDLIVERAYDEITDRVQQPVVFKKDGERVENKLTLPNHIPYLKLHGCITEIHNKEVPLIITPTQYIEHRKNRKRLFSMLEELAYEYPIVFAGYSLADINIRTIMRELERELGDTRPRSYLVSPRFSDAEKRMWLAKRITPIELGFEDFLVQADREIGPGLRKLVVATTPIPHAICRKFDAGSNRTPSEAFWSFVNAQVEFLHSGAKVDAIDPKAFYKGYFENWSPIEMKLDVPRTVANDIMVEVFLEDESDKVKRQELICIKGHAGSGKSVLLWRVAWDAAIKMDKLCIVYSERIRIDEDALLELYSLTRERVFLFIDKAAEYEGMISQLLSFASMNEFPLTIITAERYNEWNESCKRLNPLVDTYYELNYLNRNEIRKLLVLLETHKSLGHLESMNEEERIHQFEVRAERQLLVALHEVTHGKPLSDIVLDEYNSIKSHKAKLLYMTVAILHRLGVHTRAGVVSRLYKIPFTDFKEELYEPLQYIVFDKKDKITGDMYYHTRHQHIAEVLFEHALPNQDDRYYYYSQIISSLNIDYESDREAFRGLTKARELGRIFGNNDHVLNIYRIAEDHVGEDANLLQQMAIFEMKRNSGSFEVAEKLLKTARDLAPWNKNIAHSLAELHLKKAGKADNEFEREKHRRKTFAIAHKITNSGSPTPHAHHTLLKLGIMSLEDALKDEDNVVVQSKMKDFEQTMIVALREFPHESFILDAEAQYKTIVDKHPEALIALEKAFEVNKRIAYVALRLAATYQSLDRTIEAIHTLKECARLNPTNKDVNYRLARLLMHSGAKNADIKHYLRESFVKGGSGYEAQFWYARLLYIDGEISEANQIFKNTEKFNGDIKLLKEARGIVTRNDKAEIFRGTINSIHASFAFITRDGTGDKLFMHRAHQHKASWDTLRGNQRVKFQIGFTYKGPVALEVSFE